MYAQRPLVDWFSGAYNKVSLQKTIARQQAELSSIDKKLDALRLSVTTARATRGSEGHPEAVVDSQLAAVGQAIEGQLVLRARAEERLKAYQSQRESCLSSRMDVM